VKNHPLPLNDDETSPVLMSQDGGDVADASPAATVRPRARRRLAGLDARQRQQRIVRYVLLFVSAAFMVNALVGDNGLLATIKASRRYEQLQREVNALRAQNQADLLEMNRLKHDPAAIEEAARKDLGLIRPGETLVIIKDKSK